jgi:hypothetical protein
MNHFDMIFGPELLAMQISYQKYENTVEAIKWTYQTIPKSLINGTIRESIPGIHHTNR